MGQSNSNASEQNNNSARDPSRPPLRSSLSASSTATVTSSGSYKGNSKQRRKSIELPDLDPSLAFTSASVAGTLTSPQTSPTNLKSKSKPTVATFSRPANFTAISDSAKNAARDRASNTSITPTSSQYPNVGRSHDPLSSLADDTADLSIEMKEDDLIESGARLTPSLIKSADKLNTVNATLIPPILDSVLKESAHSAYTSPDAIPLPRNFSLLGPSGNTPQHGHSPAPLLHSTLPPFKPPSETVVAPEVPSGDALPLGTGAGPHTSLIMGSPIPSATATPISSPSLENVTAAQQSSNLVIAPIEAVPLPAAAPVAILAGRLANNPAAAEAVKAATVDLGAGPDGIPTLLTWTPGEGEGKEGGVATGEGMPQKVYVTGTFAKGWTTKIELRKKKSQSDFSALVNLPPGPHRLKFIVDKQWKTSRNLPSATDQDGNLINYLQVSVPGTPNTTSREQVAAQTRMDEEEYWHDFMEQRWTTDIPDALVAFGEMQEAEEAAYEAQDEHNRKLVAQGLHPIPVVQPQITPTHPHLVHPVAPPSLPAQLQRGVLNSIVLVAQGSGDDNSLLPKPDHSVIDHLAASPITKGLLSVGVTKRYRKKFVTTVLYKPTPTGILPP